MARSHQSHVGKLFFTLLAVVFFGLLFSTQAKAANPATISFQGKVVNSNGTNVTNGNYNFVFKLYSVASGGSAIWTETDTLTVSGGIFQVNLGAGCSFFTANACNGNTPVDFNANPNLYLGVTFNADPAGEMSPRVQLQSVPFAFNSDRVGGLSVSQLVQLSPSSQQSGTINVSGDVTTAANIQGNAVNGVGGINTGASGGTQRIDNSGNLLNIGSITGSSALVVVSGGIAQDITVDASTSGVVKIGSASTGNIELGGGVLSGSGCTLTNSTGDFSCTGALSAATGASVGSTTTAGSIVFKDGTGSGNTASITAPVITAPYALTLPDSGPATSQCLRTDSVVASQLVFGSCATIGQKLTQTFNAYSINQGANATTAMNYLMPTTGTAFSIALAGTTEFKATAAGSFRACTLFSSANVTGGSVSVRFRKNGANVSATNHCTLSTTNPRSNSEEVTSGLETFNAGDTIGVALVSTGLTPATLENWATFTVEYGAGGVGPTSMQDAYDNGGTVTTTDAKDIVYNLSNTTTDSNLLINIATGSTAKFAVQNNGVDALSVGASGDLLTSGTINTASISGGSLSATAVNALKVSANDVEASGAATFTINANGAQQISIGGISTGDILIGGGSASTGCTVSNANGDITCTGIVQGATVTSSGALQGNSLSINSGALAINSFGAITASTGATITGTVSASVSLSSPLVTTVAALTLNSAAGNSITIDSAGAGAAAINVGGSNATAVNISRTGQTTTVNGALTVSQNATFNNSSTTGNNVALVNNIANFVGNGLSISNTGNTNGTSLAITEGTTLRTGGGLSITGASYNHAASETAALAKLSFTDATTSVVTSTTSGLTISPTINAASGAATRTINGLSVEPTFTACSAGSCAVNGVNVGNVVDGTGFTGTGLNIGTGWDTGISVASGGINVSSGNIVTSNLGIQFTGGTAPTCAVGEYKIFADTTGTQLKKCVDGVISEIQQDQIRSFVSSTSVAAVDNNTSSYWRTAAENNNSYPNITLSATDKQIFGIATIETTATSNNDSEVTGRIEVSTTSGRACNTGTQVGGQIGTFSSNNGAQKASTSSFVYSPASTAKQYFNICADSSTVGTTSRVSRIRVSLWEVDNSNADLAEVYPTNDTSLKAGDLVSIDPTLENGVKKSNSSYDSQLVGVVSTSPALVIGGKGSQGANGVPVALSGRVLVKVSFENGPIKTGDVLTASSVPGVAMKATKAGTVIGIAMADYNGGDNNAIMTFVKPGFANGSTLADVLATNNVSTVDTSVTQAALTYFASQKDQLASSLNLSEITTDRLSAGLEIITPKVTTNELLTDTLAPATGTNVQLKLGADGTFKLVDANGVAQVSFDAAGNAQFAGTVTASKITANQIEGLASFVQDVATQTDTATSSTATTTNPGLSGAPNVIFGSVQAANLTVLAQLEAKGGLIVDKDAQFNGKTIFELLATFNGPATFNDNVNVSKQLVLSNDAGGTALIKQGQQTVDINFTNPYSQAPIVTASWILPTDSNNQVIPYTSTYNFYVTKTTVNGFQIVLDKPAEQDLILNWAATAIKDAKISTSTAP